MEIVLAKLEDCKALGVLKKKVLQTTYRGIYKDEDLDNYDCVKREEKLKKYILNNEQKIYVCKDKDEIVGYMIVGTPIYDGLDGYEYCINDLGIKEEYRGKGIGTQFFKKLKDENVRFYNCCNYYNDKAKRFYEKMGGKIAKVEMDENDKEHCHIYYIY